MQLRLVALVASALIIGACTSACSSDQGGPPLTVYITNATETPISITHVVDGLDDVVLMTSVPAHARLPLTLRDTQLATCSLGDYVAKGPDGVEIARRSKSGCTDWTVEDTANLGSPPTPSES